MQNRGDGYMRSINSVQGALTNRFRIKPKRKDGIKKGDKLAAKTKKKRDKERRDAEASDEEEEEQEESRVQRRARHREGVKGDGSRGKVNQMYQADFSMLSEEHQDKIKKTDQSLDQIGNLLDDMKIMALEMGDELDDHNARLAVLNESVTKANSRMKHTNAKITKKI